MKVMKSLVIAAVLCVAQANAIDFSSELPASDQSPLQKALDSEGGATDSAEAFSTAGSKNHIKESDNSNAIDSVSKLSVADVDKTDEVSATSTDDCTDELDIAGTEDCNDELDIAELKDCNDELDIAGLDGCNEEYDIATEKTTGGKAGADTGGTITDTADGLSTDTTNVKGGDTGADILTETGDTDVTQSDIPTDTSPDTPTKTDSDCSEEYDIADCTDEYEIASNDDCTEEYELAGKSDMIESEDMKESDMPCEEEFSIAESENHEDAMAAKTPGDMSTSNHGSVTAPSSPIESSKSDLMLTLSPLAANSESDSTTATTSGKDDHGTAKQTAFSAEAVKIQSGEPARDSINFLPFVACVALAVVGAIYMKRRSNKSKKAESNIFAIDKNSAL